MHLILFIYYLHLPCYFVNGMDQTVYVQYALSFFEGLFYKLLNYATGDIRSVREQNGAMIWPVPESDIMQNAINYSIISRHINKISMPIYLS